MTRDVRWRALTASLLPIMVLCSAVPSLRASGDWSPPLNLSSSAIWTEAASIAVDRGGRTHVVWSEGGEIFHLFYDGSSWSAPAYVAAGTQPDLAADAVGGVHLAYANRFADIDDIYFVSWQAVTGWNLPVNVSEGGGVSLSPQLAVAADGSFALVWSAQSDQTQLVYAAHSMDGVVWSSWPIPNAHGTHPVAGFSPTGDLMVAWEERYDEVGSPSEVFFTRQSGNQWTLPVDVSASPDIDSRAPSLAVGQAEVYLAWQEAALEGPAVYLSVMDDGGWSVPQRRTGSGQAFAPAIAIDPSGNGHMVWTTASSVRYATWSYLTGEWQPVEAVAVGQAEASQASVALQGAVHVTWLAEASADNLDVYHSMRAMAPPSPTPEASRLFLPCVLLNSKLAP